MSKPVTSLKWLEARPHDYAWAWLWCMWPMIGVRYFVGVFSFWWFKQPQKVLLVLNYPSFIPFVLWYFPHLRLGEWVWQAETLNYNFSEMWAYVSTDSVGSVVALLPSVGHAITGRGLLAPLHFATGLALYYGLKKLFKRA